MCYDSFKLINEENKVREIKFRFWNKFDCKMINFDLDDIYGGKIEFGALSFRLESDYVMQFTGLTDVDGVEIYEGDIVDDHVGRGVVKYSEKNAAFRVVYADGMAKWFYDYTLNGERASIVVIDNIHETQD